MLVKLLVPVAALFMLSGCCRYLGICTSASIHTSISSPVQFAQPACPRDGQVIARAPILGATLATARDLPN